MVRGFIKTGVSSAIHASGADWLLAARRRQPVVLGYHRVVDDFAAHATYSIPAMLISRAMLDRHLDWIGRRFQIVSLDELRSRVAARSWSARPIAAITFDDGYRDFYEHAFPLLKRKGIPAAVFAVTDCAGTSEVLPHDKLYLLLARASTRWASFSRELLQLLGRLDIALPNRALIVRSTTVHAALRILITTLSRADVQRIIDALDVEYPLPGDLPDGLRPLSWEMLAEISDAGIVVGSHTKTHILLTNEEQGKVIDETTGSRNELERRLGRAVTCFAYPDGRFDAAAVRAVAAAGYEVAVTTCRHRDPEYPWLTLPRVLLWEQSSAGARGRFSGAILSCQLNGLFDVLSACRQPHSDATFTLRSYGECHSSPASVQRTMSASGR
jgi:peptidoglycan/xylan/chitin deacetylase (PgdA/CDA1 family)